MIIIEGCDGAGKTTLIDLLQHTGLKVRALRTGVGATKADGTCSDTTAAPGVNDVDEAPIAYARKIYEHLGGLLASTCQIAFDRFHLSERVYGPLLRGESGITMEETVVLHRLLHARGIPIVVCLPPFETALANVCREGRERPSFQTEQFLRVAYDAWRDLVHREGYFKFDFTKDPVPDGAWRPTAWQTMLTCPPRVIGSPAARFLIVGEQSNLPLDLPFFSMRGASGYLNRALWHAGFQEEELAFTNALSDTGEPLPLQAQSSTRVVLALGAVAQRAAARWFPLERGLLTFNLPHPEYLARHREDKSADEAYVQTLTDVRNTVS